MVIDQLTYELSRVAYILSIGAAILLITLGLMALVAGVIIMLDDDPADVGSVPFPRSVDGDE